ncbi:MAG: iron-sulfur cluster assembly protein [Planctomycetota bacterium]|nr:iron-sulfur cluster assembly protein [Planctomycetota bacterium]
MPTAAEVREKLKEIYDPEIPINIVDLGLIYEVKEAAPGDYEIVFTLTNPACPVQDQLAAKMIAVAAELDGVEIVTPKLVFDPPWNKEKMTFEGKLQANLLGFG